MTPEQAAIVIQRAWRFFEEERGLRYCQEYQKELMDTYYHQCGVSTRTYVPECDDYEISFSDMYPERPIDYEGMMDVIRDYNDLIEYDD
jgi:hypothetical protein